MGLYLLPGEEYQAEVTPKTQQIWALVDGIDRDRHSKIRWRTAEPGDFNIYADGLAGRQLRPTQGPIQHYRGGLDRKRPGIEWGTGWLFPDAGCWTFHISIGKVFARLSVLVH